MTVVSLTRLSHLRRSQTNSYKSTDTPLYLIGPTALRRLKKAAK